MKGLLIKDLRLMKVQKRFFLVVIVMAILLAFSTRDNLFLIGYLSFVLPLFALSTISYDEFDNGNAFLFTLPVSRKGYVLEKYCLGALLGIASLISAVLLSLCMNAVSNMPLSSDTLQVAPLDLLAVLIILSVMIPLQLKFGAEKGRIATIVLGGITFIIGLALVKILRALNIDLSAVLDGLSALHVGVLIAIAIALVLAAVAVSILVSMAIMAKKEF